MNRLLKSLLNLFQEEDIQSTELTPQQLYKQVVDSVVYIETLTGQGTVKYGSGVIISKEGTILTAAHVVKDASLINIEMVDGKKYTAVKSTPFDEGRDLGVLKIQQEALFEPVMMRDLKTNPLFIGAKLFAIGSPFRQKFSYTEGIVSQLRDEVVNPGNYVVKNAIQTDAALNPGNSGGGGFDRKGRLVGIASLILSPKGTSEGVGYLIGTTEITKFLGGG